MAFSEDGLHFEVPVLQPPLAASYARIFSNPEGRLFAITRAGTLWRAPLSTPFTTQLPHGFQTFWEVLNPDGAPLLQRWVARTAGGDAWANHFGLAFLSPTLLEVRGKVGVMEGASTPPPPDPAP